MPRSYGSPPASSFASALASALASSFGASSFGSSFDASSFGSSFDASSFGSSFDASAFGSSFDASAFGTGTNNRFGLDFGYTGLDLGLDLYAGGGLSKGGGRTTLDEVLRVITTLSPIIAALFGREREYARSRGAQPATGAGAPSGYTRIRNPDTGEELDVPDDLVGQYAQRYTDAYNAGAGGGISGTTLAIGAAVLGGAWWISRRTP